MAFSIAFSEPKLRITAKSFDEAATDSNNMLR